MSDNSVIYVLCAVLAIAAVFFAVKRFKKYKGIDLPKYSFLDHPAVIAIGKSIYNKTTDNSFSRSDLNSGELKHVPVFIQNGVFELSSAGDSAEYEWTTKGLVWVESHLLNRV